MSAKVEDPIIKDIFTTLTPGKAKALGRKIELRKDWEYIKVGVMKTILIDKFLKNPELATLLRSTSKSTYLEETNDWGDSFWGFDIIKWEGENMLGKLLMEVRTFIS